MEAFRVTDLVRNSRSLSETGSSLDCYGCREDWQTANRRWGNTRHLRKSVYKCIGLYPISLADVQGEMQKLFLQVFTFFSHVLQNSLFGYVKCWLWTSVVQSTGWTITGSTSYKSVQKTVHRHYREKLFSFQICALLGLWTKLSEGFNGLYFNVTIAHQARDRSSNLLLKRRGTLTQKSRNIPAYLFTFKPHTYSRGTAGMF